MREIPVSEQELIGQAGEHRLKRVQTLLVGGFAKTASATAAFLRALESLGRERCL